MKTVGFIASKRPFICAACRRNRAIGRKRSIATSAPVPPEIYDVVTVGGGPVGLSLIAALKSFPETSALKIALLETQDLSKAQQWSSPPDQYSNRASSLTPASLTFLETIGAWTHVDPTRTQPYGEMQVWDGGNNSHLQFDWRSNVHTYNAPPRSVATMTENANLTRGLLERISKVADSRPISLLSNTTVTKIENGEDDPDGLNLSSWPVVSTQSRDDTSPTSKIAARLLIGADGPSSPVRAFAGIPSHGWDYNRHGLVATLKTAPPEDSFDSFFSDTSPTSTAYQRFLPTLGGPVALLPLPDNYASLVWSITPQHATYLKSLPEESLVAMINAAFRLSQPDLAYMLTLPPNSPSSPTTPPTFSHEDELSWRLAHTRPPHKSPPFVTSVQPKSVASFPLRLRHAGTYVSPRVALIGDAAHSIHPLAGQGLNLGLGDAAALARTIKYAVEHGQDLGDILTLERYNCEVWGRNAKVAGACDLLHKVYGVDGALPGWIRGIGMSALESGLVPGLKSWVMTQAEG